MWNGQKLLIHNALFPRNHVSIVSIMALLVVAVVEDVFSKVVVEDAIVDANVEGAQVVVGVDKIREVGLMCVVEIFYLVVIQFNTSFFKDLFLTSAYK